MSEVARNLAVICCKFEQMVVFFGDSGLYVALLVGFGGAEYAQLAEEERYSWHGRR
ncbi:hypothetical protein [Comamonas sp. lk]|uniref:hypothetical protein n=1 Tax=Comamonas sp. lk TaxID=2201272 RepID=UPI0013CE7658|nr:hypothetical protein [Comamonas sp. lk]